MSEAVSEGNYSALESTLPKLIGALTELSTTIDVMASSAPPRPTPEEFASDIEVAMASSPEHTGAKRNDLRIICGATVTRIIASGGGDIAVMIGQQVFRTTSTARILEIVSRQNKEKFDPKKVIKALRDAFQLHTSVSGVDPTTAVVPLESLRKLISITRDGNPYSTEQLTDDIQRLMTNHRDSMEEAGFEFVPIPAARAQFEFIEATGNISHIGGLRLSLASGIQP